MTHYSHIYNDVSVESYISKFKHVDTSFSHKYRELYLRFSSNAHLCGISTENYLDMFLNIVRSEYLNTFLSKRDSVKFVKQIGNYECSPQIFSTIHLGAHKLIVGKLLQEGINLCIPISNQIYMEQQESFISIRNHFSEYKGNLIFVDIEQRDGIFSLIKHIKQGYSLLMYLDGNSGIGGMDRADSKLECINFFNRKILVRKGIGFLARILRLPIQPVISFFDADFNPNIHFLPTIASATRCHNELDRNKSESYFIQNLWNIFESYIAQYPHQWEAWLYADTFFKNDNLIKANICFDQPLLFNKNKYSFLEKSNKFYLYNLADCTLVKMSRGLYHVLYTIHSKGLILSMDELRNLLQKQSLVDDLISKEIFIN